MPIINHVTPDPDPGRKSSIINPKGLRKRTGRVQFRPGEGVGSPFLIPSGLWYRLSHIQRGPIFHGELRTTANIRRHVRHYP
jgi:hypothetical protein